METVIEFKPKWLVQSPSAPKNAVRCRQCSRVARSNAELARKKEPLQMSFCPLDLTIHEGYRLARVAFPPEKLDEMLPRFNAWLSGNTLLPRLRQMQMELDHLGVLKNDKNNDKFRAAMTLRDCTVFVRFRPNAEFDPEAKDDFVEARIGDLDLKSPDKAQYWKDTENTLIEEGWYTGTEKDEDHQPLTCQLSPKRQDSPKAQDAMRDFLLSNS
jgi:inositol-pentakisphosphate 2-kinase